MNKFSLLAIFLIVSCSSIPKTTIPNHNIQLTCEMGSRYFFINLQDVPKKTGVISTTMELVSDNACINMPKEGNARESYELSYQTDI